jgi:hypothetical protein
VELVLLTATMVAARLLWSAQSLLATPFMSDMRTLVGPSALPAPMCVDEVASPAITRHRSGSADDTNPNPLLSRNHPLPPLACSASFALGSKSLTRAGFFSGGFGAVLMRSILAPQNARRHWIRRMDSGGRSTVSIVRA